MWYDFSEITIIAVIIDLALSSDWMFENFIGKHRWNRKWIPKKKSVLIQKFWTSYTSKRAYY